MRRTIRLATVVAQRYPKPIKIMATVDAAIIAGVSRTWSQSRMTRRMMNAVIGSMPMINPRQLGGMPISTRLVMKAVENADGAEGGNGYQAEDDELVGQQAGRGVSVVQPATFPDRSLFRAATKASMASGWARVTRI